MKNTYTKKELTELFTTGNLEGLVKAMDVLEASKGYDDPLTIYAVELLNQLDDEIIELSSYEEDSDHMPQIYTEETHLPKDCWGNLI